LSGLVDWIHIEEDAKGGLAAPNKLRHRAASDGDLARIDAAAGPFSVYPPSLRGRIPFEFSKLAPPELTPARRIVIEPFSQNDARGSIFSLACVFGCFDETQWDPVFI